MVMLGRRRRTGQHGIPLRGGSECGLERNFARAGATLVERCHGLTPAGSGLLLFIRGERDANKFFRLGEGDARDLWTRCRRRAEGWRHARGRRTSTGGSGGGGLLPDLRGSVAANSRSGEADGAVFEKGAAGLDRIFERHRAWIARVAQGTA